jgi:hypothetical protein
MEKRKKNSKSLVAKRSKRKAKTGAVPPSGSHKGRFDQLLGDAILGVNKK